MCRIKNKIKTSGSHGTAQGPSPTIRNDACLAPTNHNTILPAGGFETRSYGSTLSNASKKLSSVSERSSTSL